MSNKYTHRRIVHMLDLARARGYDAQELDMLSEDIGIVLDPSSSANDVSMMQSFTHCPH